MATFPSKVNYATGDILTAANMNDVGGAINLLESAQLAAGKNKFINGDFSVWQRGTTLGPTAGLNAYLADRFLVTSTGDTVTYSQQTFTAGAAPTAGYEAQYFARQVVAFSAGAGNFTQMLQRVENVRNFAGQTVTISYWAKADAAKSVSWELQQNFGSGGSTSVNTFIVKQALTTSWARYSTTFTVPAVTGKTIGANSYLDFRVWLSAGSTFDARTSSLGQQNITFDTWGWQVEEASTASDFQTATGTLAGELAACQRYYWRSSSTTNYTYFPGAGLAKSTTVAEITISHPVTMRTATPTIDYSNINVSDGVTLATGGTLAMSASTEVAAHITATYASGLTAFRAYFLQGAVGLSYIGFNSEL